MAYVGSVLELYLKSEYPGSKVFGFDAGYFASCVLDKELLPESRIDCQYFGDVRNFPDEILNDVTTVIHLAAISNDPMGNEFEDVTGKINFEGTINLARKAKEHGVKKFVFASSCSVYGFAGDFPKTENDNVNPLTAYAKSKIDSENSLRLLADDTFTITCLRFATACGYSPRLRLDLVLNDFVASAISSGKISILSDGSPWRPLIDVSDMARAINWAASRKAEHGGSFLIVNTGSNEGNYNVKQLAEAVVAILPGTEITINPNAVLDRRSYKVDFTLFETLAIGFLPKKNLRSSITEIMDGLIINKFSDTNFRNSKLIRLNVLKQLQSDKVIDDNLWYI